MRIAQIAPLFESVPPAKYGGTERCVHYLTESLVDRGHDVVLFASGDSQTSGELCPCAPRSLRTSEQISDAGVYTAIQLGYVMEQIDRFDILHFHLGCSHFPMAKHLEIPHVSTMHGPVTGNDHAQLLKQFNKIPLVSISNSQRHPCTNANWLKTIHHGLPRDLYEYKQTNGTAQYLAFIGRISPEKGIDRAIEIANRMGLPLKIAAKIDHADQAYYREHIAPMIAANAKIEFIGEINDQGKQQLLSQALALLFPVDWPEPFGLVMIEANACGTPVVAWRNGSTPEVINDGINGYIVESIDNAVSAIKQLEKLDRLKIRQNFESRFCADKEAEEYENVYRQLIQTHNCERKAIRRLNHAA
ncbi:MAG: glycosyltransferase family 4 protein [Synechococcus lacustris]